MNRLLVLLALAFWTTASYAQDEPVRSIETITGDLYRFQENNHYGVFLVTGDGIILADPISHDNAVWLKAELDARFDVPVKYVIYSHDHADHTSGGEVFAETATFVAHENAKAKIAASGHTPVPTETFDEWYTVVLGGREVVLYYPGPSHSDNLISIIFPDERALFQVDSVAVNRLPYRDLPKYTINGTINALQILENFNFKILIPGHGPVGTKKDLVNHRKYLEALNEAVVEAIINEVPLEQAQQTILLTKYKNWDQYEAWRALNIEGVYRIYNTLRGEVLLLRRVKPLYPGSAMRMDLCGWVMVKYNITAEGNTENIEVEDSEPPDVFDKVARNAVAKYKYLPVDFTDDVVTLVRFEIEGICEIPPVRQRVAQ